VNGIGAVTNYGQSISSVVDDGGNNMLLDRDDFMVA